MHFYERTTNSSAKNQILEMLLIAPILPDFKESLADIKNFKWRKRCLTYPMNPRKLNRIGIALSFFWVLGVSLVALSNLLLIRPGDCIFPVESMLSFSEFSGFFVSCSPFSDLKTTWFAIQQIQIGQQHFEFEWLKFCLWLFLPVFIVALGITAWKWIGSA